MKNLTILIFTLTFTLIITNENLGQCNQDQAEKCDISPGTNKVSIKIGGFWRVVTSNGIPDHDIGIFPMLHPDCGRPTPLKAQHNTYVIPAYPDDFTYRSSYSFTYTPVPNTIPFGVAVNGIPLDPEAAEWYRGDRSTGWQKNPVEHPDMKYDLDCNHGHVQPQDPDATDYKNYDTYFNTETPNGGPYHYHALPVNLYKRLGGQYPWKFRHRNGNPRQKKATTVLLGWSFDGAPVYGPLCFVPGVQDPNKYDWWVPSSNYKIKEFPGGLTPKGPGIPEDAYLGYYVQDYEYERKTYDPDFPPLDMCNGHFAPTPQNPDGEYHYHITMHFPYIPRCHRIMEKMNGPTTLKFD